MSVKHSTGNWEAKQLTVAGLPNNDVTWMHGRLFVFSSSPLIMWGQELEGGTVSGKHRIHSVGWALELLIPSPSPTCIDLRSVPPFIILCSSGVRTQDSCQPLHYTSRHVIGPFKTTVIYAGVLTPKGILQPPPREESPFFREVSESETHTGQFLECKYQSFQKSMSARHHHMGGGARRGHAHL